MAATIQIALATYNGAGFLREQLDSILAQSKSDWQILVRDDGSSDGTVEIIREYCRNHGKIDLVKGAQGQPLGTVQNFAELLRQSESDYVMLADQDDVWLPHKIEITLLKMKELESAHGKDTPLLVHTDLKVVDGDLKVLANSLWHFQKSDPERGAKLCRLLLQNVATGCTMMVNKALRDRALPIPLEAIMHDWWLALTAAAFGHIGYISEPTVLYRQHGRNDTGARSWNAGHVLRQLTDLQSTRQTMRRTQTQAAAFLHRFNDELRPHDRALVEAYAGIHEQGFLLRRYNLAKYGFAYTGLLRNIGLYVFV